jgi:hypothetical protein
VAGCSEQDCVRGFGFFERLVGDRLALFPDRHPAYPALFVGERHPEVLRRDVHHRPGGLYDLRSDAVAREQEYVERIAHFSS